MDQTIVSKIILLVWTSSDGMDMRGHWRSGSGRGEFLSWFSHLLHSWCLGFFLPIVTSVLQAMFKVLNCNILFRVLEESQNRRGNVAFEVFPSFLKSSVFHSKIPHLSPDQMILFSFLFLPKSCFFAFMSFHILVRVCHCL